MTPLQAASSQQQFYDKLVRRAPEVTGVRSAAMTSSLPMTYDPERREIVPEGYDFPPGKEAARVLTYIVDEHYFETFGVPVLAGRGFRSKGLLERFRFDLRALGAEVRPVPAVPYKDPNNYQKIAGRLAQEIGNAIWANQFDNLANRQAHYQTTGPEIWRDTAGTVDAFVCATKEG